MNQLGFDVFQIPCRLANVYLATGATDEAIPGYEEAIRISRELADLQTEALASGNLGRAHYLNNDPNRAIELYQTQLEISLRLGDRLSEANAHFNLALAFEQKGEAQQASVEARAALTIYEQLESPNAERVRQWIDRFANRIP